MNAVDFIYDRLGQYIAPGEDKMAWAMSAVLYNKDGKKVSFRGPGKPTVLVSESGVWVQTTFLPPDSVPPHIHWGVENVFGLAVRQANELGAWYGIQFSNAGPKGFIHKHSVNIPGSDVFTFRLDSGRQAVSWKPALVNELVAIVRSVFQTVDAKTVFALADYVATGKWSGRPLNGRPLNRDQQRAARTVYNLLAREQPEALLHDGRRGLRSAIDALTVVGPHEKGEANA